MLSVDGVSAAAGTSYFEKGNDDYYFKEGNGTDLNTDKKIDLDNFTKNVRDRIRETGGDTKKKDKIAEDLTFSAPKSVSISAALGDEKIREDMFNAHDRAVKNVMNYIKDSNMIRANIHGDKEGELADKNSISLAKFNHFTNRNQDPQLHSHVLIANAVKNMDGKLTSTNLKEIYQNQKNLGALYRQELAKELEKKDYKIEWDKDGKGTFELKGFTKEQLQDFSTRRQEIEDKLKNLEEKGMDTESGKVKELATLETRKAKEHVDPEQLEKTWKERGEQAGINIDNVIRENKQENLQDKKNTEDKEIEDKEKELLKENVVKEVIQEQIDTAGFTDNNKAELMLAKSLAERGVTVSTQEIKEMVKKEMENNKDFNNLYNNKFGKEYFTTNNTLNSNIKNIQNPIRNEQISLDKEKTEKTFNDFNNKLEQEKGFKLDSKQGNLVKNIATNDKDFSVLGKAGAGKTTMMEALKEVYNKQGLEVMGVSVSGAAVANLQKETGIQSSTIDSLAFKQDKILNNLEKEGKNLGLIIVDEAGMLDSKRVSAIREFAEKSGSKILYVGDTEQLKPVGAGDPFKQIVTDGQNKDSFGELIDIYRQKDKGYKDAVVKSSMGQNLEAFKKLDEMGWVKRIGSKNERFQAITKEYIDNKKQGKETLVVAGTNNDVDRLNKEIKHKLQKEGLVDNKEGLKVKTKDSSGKDMGEKEFNLKDKVMFLKNDNKLGVKNGLTGTVKNIDKENGTLTVGTKFGDKTIDTKKYNNLNYGYAMTVHKSQGQTVDKVIFAADKKNTNANSFYVGISRGREKASIYLDNKQEDKFKENILTKQEKANIITLKSKGLDKTGKKHESYVKDLKEGKEETIGKFTNINSYKKYSAGNDLKENLAGKSKRDEILNNKDVRREVAENIVEGKTDFSKTSEKIANKANEKENYNPKVNNEMKQEVNKSFNRNELKQAVRKAVLSPNRQAYKDATKPTLTEKIGKGVNTVKRGVEKVNNVRQGIRNIVNREVNGLLEPPVSAAIRDVKHGIKNGVKRIVNNIQNKSFNYFARQGKFERAYLAGALTGMSLNKLEAKSLTAKYRAGKIGMDKINRLANSHMTRLFNPGAYRAAKQIADAEKAKQDAQLKVERRNHRNFFKASEKLDKHLNKREKLMNSYYKEFYKDNPNQKKLDKLKNKINKTDKKITREAGKATVLSKHVIIGGDRVFKKGINREINKHLEKMDKLQEKYKNKFLEKNKNKDNRVKKDTKQEHNKQVKQDKGQTGHKQENLQNKDKQHIDKNNKQDKINYNKQQDNRDNKQNINSKENLKQQDSKQNNLYNKGQDKTNNKQEKINNKEHKQVEQDKGQGQTEKGHTQDKQVKQEHNKPVNNKQENKIKEPEQFNKDLKNKIDNTNKTLNGPDKDKNKDKVNKQEDLKDKDKQQDKEHTDKTQDKGEHKGQDRGQEHNNRQEHTDKQEQEHNNKEYEQHEQEQDRGERER